eukprot:746627-Hanusia_phi.AAC.1
MIAKLCVFQARLIGPSCSPPPSTQSLPPPAAANHWKFFMPRLILSVTAGLGRRSRVESPATRASGGSTVRPPLRLSRRPGRGRDRMVIGPYRHGTVARFVTVTADRTVTVRSPWHRHGGGAAAAAAAAAAATRPAGGACAPGPASTVRY